jgi:hypothetical protein
VEWALKTFSDSTAVIYVCGNHKFYDGSNSIPTLFGKLINMTRNTHVSLLENDSIFIDGITAVPLTFKTEPSDSS